MGEAKRRKTLGLPPKQNNNKTDYARINFMTCFKEPCSGDNIIEEFVYFQE